MKKLLFLACFLLVGCKAELYAVVKLSDVKSKIAKQQEAELYVDVAACNDYADSRQPSDSLIQAQNAVERVFNGAEFKECYREEMDSIALFSIPIHVGGDHQSDLINITSLDLENGQDAVIMEMPKKMRDRITRENRNSLISLEPSIGIRLINDSGKQKSLLFFSAYVDEHPLVLERYSINRESEIVLSDTSVDLLLSSGMVKIALN